MTSGWIRSALGLRKGISCMALWTAAMTAVVGLIGVPLANASATTPDRVFINAKAAVVMDVKTHKLLYEKNSETPMYPASTTKLMTAILLVTHLDADDDVYISPEAAAQPKVRLGLKSGITITADEALRAILMKSANDVAYAVAQTVGGSQQGFARMMNLKARLVGCTHTNFVTPNGLHEDAHMTTAHDVALITAAAVQYPRIVAAMQTPSCTIASKFVPNTNRMMQIKSPTFGTNIGGKTGYTSKAMYCLAFAAKQNGDIRVSVVLGAPRKSFMYSETRRLLEFSYRNKDVTLV